MNAAIAWAKVAGLAIVAANLWMVQALWAATKLVGRVFGFLLKGVAAVGIAGVFLLFVPVIGWAILGIWLLIRRGNRQHAETIAAIRGTVEVEETRPPLFGTPWLLPSLKTAIEEARITTA